MTDRETKPMKRYKPSWSGQRWVRKHGVRWMDQPTWARTMVYIVIGYIIGFTWSAWVS